MQKVDGWQVCREIRQYSDVPIIMLTARSDERTNCSALSLEWTSIFPSPSAQKILVARVEAVLRRTAGVDDAVIEIRASPLTRPRTRSRLTGYRWFKLQGI